MITSWKSFKQWCHAHPFKWATFVFVVCVIAGLVGDVPDSGIIAAAIAYGVIFVVVYTYDMRRMGLLSISLATLLAMPCKAQDSQPEAGGVAIGVTVIVIGGVAYYFLTKTCQKLFPKPPTKTNELYAAGTPTDCAASFSYQSPHSCKLPDPSLLEYEHPPTLMDIEIEGGDAPRVVEIRRSTASVVGFSGFSEALATHGIQLSERPGENYYGMNGRPADGGQVPISFNPLDNSVIVGRGKAQKLTIERSNDFEHWEPMATVSLPQGMRAVVCDASDEQQMFYRIK